MEKQSLNTFEERSYSKQQPLYKMRSALHKAANVGCNKIFLGGYSAAFR